MRPIEEIKNPKDYSLNWRFFKRMIGLIRPYWTRPGAWRSWLVFGVCISYTLAEVALGAKVSMLTQQMTDALVARQQVSYWHLFLLVTLIGLVINGGVLGQFFSFVYDWMTLQWRTWLTRFLLQRYLQARTYYRIEEDGDTDNVDQRIQQETGPFCETLTLMPNILLFTLTNFGTQGWILRSISPVLFYCVIIYGFATALITAWLYRPYIRLNFDSTVAEADLRFGILHVRNHAETVALYRGEIAEAASVEQRLRRAVRIALVTLRYRLWMNVTQTGLGVVWTVMPVIVLVPLYFADSISFGVITQGTVSATMLLSGIQRLTQFVPMFATAVPHVVRLAQIAEKADAVLRREGNQTTAIQFRNGQSVQVDRLTLHTPGRERTLLCGLDLRINAGEHLLVMGQTGVGKSSLLRAMSGLWRNGEGTITMPDAGSVLFLPQRPYMLLGSLREQVLYPATASTLSDAQLQALLDRVSLPDLAARHGGFDTVIDWSRVLSLGEQQRIGFARALAARPRYVFLDEATSAVDVATESRLYRELAASGATFVSIGHRSSLLAHHIRVLELHAEGAWRLLSARQAQEEVDRLKDEDLL